MKIIFIVLLIAALGAGAFFYFSKKKTSSSTQPKELIVGKWKIDSLDLTKTRDSSLNVLVLILAATDTNLHRYDFDFTSEGSILQSLNGKTEDTSHYEFAEEKEMLVWSKNDSTKTKFTIRQLDSLHLVMQDKDSTVFSFKRAR